MMEDTTIQHTISRFWFFALIACFLLWLAYFFTKSDFILIPAILVTIGLFKGDGSGRAVIGGVSWIKRLAERHALEEWQGNYFSFNNLHIRIIEIEGKRWIVADDLIEAAGLEYTAELKRKLPLSYTGYRPIPETKWMGFNREATFKFIATKQHDDPEIIKLKLWLEREVYREELKTLADKQAS